MPIKSNLNDFKNKSVKIHGDKYDYSHVKYTNNYTKVEIICRTHGTFLQTPHGHLKGRGCNIYGGSNKNSNENFSFKAAKIHNNIYDYSLINYINNIKKIDIICSKHGIFKQSPRNHISGDGCPKCNNSKGEAMIEKILLDYHVNYLTQYKFNDLFIKNKLKFDFAILSDKKEILCLIEYNGIQHYELRKRFHKTEKDFETSKYRDKIKLEYCSNKNIPLHIIKYNDIIYDKIKNILSSFGII